MLLKILTGAVGLVLLTSSTARADVHTIVQKDKKFSQAELKIKPGDTVKFTNADPTTHHIMVKIDGKRFDAKQPSGSKPIDVVFEREQETTARCAIHPKMKLKIIVRK